MTVVIRALIEAFLEICMLFVVVVLLITPNRKLKSTFHETVIFTEIFALISCVINTTVTAVNGSATADTFVWVVSTCFFCSGISLHGYLIGSLLMTINRHVAIVFSTRYDQIFARRRNRFYLLAIGIFGYLTVCYRMFFFKINIIFDPAADGYVTKGYPPHISIYSFYITVIIASFVAVVSAIFNFATMIYWCNLKKEKQYNVKMNLFMCGLVTFVSAILLCASQLLLSFVTDPLNIFAYFVKRQYYYLVIATTLAQTATLVAFSKQLQSELKLYLLFVFVRRPVKRWKDAIGGRTMIHREPSRTKSNSIVAHTNTGAMFMTSPQRTPSAASAPPVVC